MNTNDLKRLAPAAASSARSRRAADGFTERAIDEGLVDVAVATMGSPVGELFVAVTPRGLVSVAFDDEPRDEVLERISRQISPRVLEAAAPTDAARRTQHAPGELADQPPIDAQVE